jgi:hypothetical protein
MPNDVARELRRSSSDAARDRAAVRDVMPGLVALLVAQGSLVMLDPHGKAGGWVLAWSLSPLVAALWLVWAQLRALRRGDEYQRKVQLEAMAIGFGATILSALAGGLLDAAGVVDPRQSLQVTFIAGVVTWIAALTIKTLRA